MKCTVGKIEFNPSPNQTEEEKLRAELVDLKEQFGKFRDKFEELAELVRSLEEHDRFYHGGNSDDE